MNNPLIVLTVTPSTTTDLSTMIAPTASADPSASPELNERMESCFQAAMTYWWDFHLTPDGKDLLKHLPSVVQYRRAFELFLFGFSGRMLLLPPGSDSPFDRLLLRFKRSALWRDYLRTCHGEVLLDGDCYPKTPALILRMAERFFNAGFLAGDCECVVRTVVSATAGNHTGPTR